MPWTDNEYWTRSMNYEVLQETQTWTVQGQESTFVGGYITRYANNFTFATVRGAGHMSPEVRPEAALHMYKGFITGTL